MLKIVVLKTVVSLCSAGSAVPRSAVPLISYPASRVSFERVQISLTPHKILGNNFGQHFTSLLRVLRVGDWELLTSGEANFKTNFPTN